MAEGKILYPQCQHGIGCSTGSFLTLYSDWDCPLASMQVSLCLRLRCLLCTGTSQSEAKLTHNKLFAAGMGLCCYIHILSASQHSDQVFLLMQEILQKFRVLIGGYAAKLCKHHLRLILIRWVGSTEKLESSSISLLQYICKLTCKRYSSHHN